MEFDSISLSHDPLLDVSFNNNINRPSRIKRSMIILSGICLIIFILLIILSLIFIVTNKQKLLSTTTTTILTSIKINQLETTKKLENCFTTSWNPIKEVLFKCGLISTLAIDDDFNIYTAQSNRYSLQKWSPNTNRSIDLFELRFQSNAIFYSSLHRSLYFFYEFNGKPGVYKLMSPIDENSIPVMVFTTSGQGSALNQLGGYCGGLYATSIGEIYIVDSSNNRVVKWVQNGTSGIIVADGSPYRYDSDHIGNPSGLFVDEINNVFYIIDTFNHRIQRFSKKSTNGTTVIGGGPTKVLSDSISEYIMPMSLLGDKNGNIYVGEASKITKWALDIKSNDVIVSQDKNLDLDLRQAGLNSPSIMAFDKLENLYVYDNAYQTIYKFTRVYTPCTKNIH